MKRNDMIAILKRVVTLEENEIKGIKTCKTGKRYRKFYISGFAITTLPWAIARMA
jgi:hypothetical protein